MTGEQKEKRQIKERQRKRVYREKRKVLKVKLEQYAFKNRQTKGKAIKKLHKVLLNTPAKRVEVIRSFFRSISPKAKVSVTERNIVPYKHFFSRDCRACCQL